MDDIIGRRKAEYEPLIEDFKKEISGLNLQNVTGPHFPCVGECYEEAKYKFVFCGMETYGWDSLEDLMKQDANKYLVNGDNRINTYQPIEWISNWNATFWGFIFKFLAKFYNTDLDKLVYDENDAASRSILKSIIWCNSNAIERFGVTCEHNGVDINVWNAVKRASKKFDDLIRVVNFCAPKVIFVLCKAAEEYIVNDEEISRIYGVDAKQKNNVLKLKHENPQYTYYYLRNSLTHVFLLPHPRWMGQFSGYGQDAYIDTLIESIKNYHIWDALPKSNKDWNIVTEDFIRNPDKPYQLMASIAHSLTLSNAVMYGGDLGRLFNMNGFRTGNAKYSEDGGRGVFSVIKYAYKYYHNRGDYQTAYEIARSFVNKNGEYSY